MFKELNTLEPFFLEPKREFSVREAAKILKVAPATASKDLFELAQQGILKFRDERLAKLYSANIEGENYKDLKRFYTQKKIKKIGLTDAINNFYNTPTIILFGPCAIGNDVDNNELDLIVVSARTDSLPDLTAYEKKFGKKIKLFVVQNLEQLSEKYLLSQISNAIVLQGALTWN